MESKKQPVLTKNDYLKTSLRSYVLQNGFNYGNYQGTGYANSIFPALRKIYKDDEEKLKELLQKLESYGGTPSVRALLRLSELLSNLVYGIQAAFSVDCSSSCLPSLKMTLLTTKVNKLNP